MKKYLLFALALLLSLCADASVIEADTLITKGDTVIIERGSATTQDITCVTIKLAKRAEAQPIKPERKTYNVTYRQCRAVLKDGERCRRNARNGSQYCDRH